MEPKIEEQSDRRPLRSRGRWWAKRATAALNGRGVTPNQVSVASIVFAAAAGIMIYFSFMFEVPAVRSVLLIGGAVGIQARLLCNLLDGMLAIESGLETKTGKIYNELPDRISDVVIMLCCGYGIGVPSLGWATALLSVLTAYIRMLGVSTGTPHYFCGPMAKPHRMAALTAACILEALIPVHGFSVGFVALGLGAVAIGAAATCVRRTIRIVDYLTHAPGI